MTQTLNIQAALELPEMRACASDLRMAGIKITGPMTQHEVSEKLSAVKVSVERRLVIKSAMAHAGLLKN